MKWQKRKRLFDFTSLADLIFFISLESSTSITFLFQCVSSWDCSDTLKFQLHNVSSTEIDSYESIYVRAAIFVGLSLICVTESPHASSLCSFWSKVLIDFTLSKLTLKIFGFYS